MDYAKYIAEITAEKRERLLEDWRWLVGPRTELWKVTKAGDALLRDEADGSIHLLDVTDGQVERICDTEADFATRLGDPEVADYWLMREIVDGLRDRGVTPQVDQCLSQKVPSFLGGPSDLENWEVCDVLVHFSVAGQLHRQTKDLPPGTRIGRILVDGQDPGAAAPESGPHPGSKRPWWKLW